jgi:hypothetical protein
LRGNSTTGVFRRPSLTNEQLFGIDILVIAGSFREAGFCRDFGVKKWSKFVCRGVNQASGSDF